MLLFFHQGFATINPDQLWNEGLRLLMVDTTEDIRGRRGQQFADDMAIIASGFEPANNLSQQTIDKWRSDISVSRSSFYIVHALMIKEKLIFC